jgi:hypothetical protein
MFFGTGERGAASQDERPNSPKKRIDEILLHRAELRPDHAVSSLQLEAPPS